LNSDVTVRFAEAGDVSAILAAHRAAVLNTASTSYSDDVLRGWAPPLDPERIQQMSENIAARDQVTLVTEVDHQVVGFGVIIPLESELRALYVHSDYGSRGVGGAIICELERLAKDRGLKLLWLAGSLNAESFYARRGYEVVRTGEHTLQSGVRMPCRYMRKKFSG
jgi:putative acetyltransferase